MFRLKRPFTQKLQVRFQGSKVPKPITQPKIEQTEIFYNNEWHKSKSGEALKVLNPSTGEVITELQNPSDEDVDAAVSAASKAFEYGSPWRTTNASQRGQLLYKLATLMEKDAVLLASLETLNNGIPFVHSYLALVKLSIKVIRYFAGWADKNHGKTIPVDGNFWCYTRHEPVGVCVGIIPWNVPIFMFSFKLAPAIALGNTVVLKPSDITPLTALRVAELSKEAGFPPGVINVIAGGAKVGESLCKHPKVDKISFTGSTRVGKLIQKYATHGNLKRTTLELGEEAHHALFFNQGQTCIAGSRTFVEAKIYDEFVTRSAERAKKRIVGDPFDHRTEQGPQINQAQVDKILTLIGSGIKEGASLMTGGKRIGDKGFFVEPTVFANVEDHHTIAREEIFGPVQQILKFDSIEEVLKRANSSNYGLAAGIYTNDLEKIHYLTQALKAGNVWVNTYGMMGAQAPFGGYKNSGWGRELGEYGLHQYTEVKNVVIKIRKKNS
ncbi:Aldh [Trypoxylus dichotomus]